MFPGGWRLVTCPSTVSVWCGVWLVWLVWMVCGWWCLDDEMSADGQLTPDPGKETVEFDDVFWDALPVLLGTCSYIIKLVVQYQCVNVPIIYIYISKYIYI